LNLKKKYFKIKNKKFVTCEIDVVPLDNDNMMLTCHMSLSYHVTVSLF